MNLTINYTSFERYIILYRANEDTFKKLIPTISFYSVLAILGVAGNIPSIYIFMTQMVKNQQNELFILLCVFNLLACGVCIPLDILEMRNMYMYPSTVLCKFARFLNMFTMVSQTLTLSALALFRLRAASSGAVVSMRRSKRVARLGFLVLLSSSLSWIAAVVFGIRSSPTFVGNITGRDCSIADDSRNTAWPPVFNVVLVIGFTSQLTVITTAYYRIWRIVKSSRVAVTAYTVPVDMSRGLSGQRKTDLFRYEDNVTILPVDVNERKTDSCPHEIKNVNIYLVNINEGKRDLSCYEDNLNVLDEEINEREEDMSTHEDNVNAFPDEINETKTDMNHHQYKLGTNTVCTAQNKHKQSNKPDTMLIVADDSVYTALVNDASTDGRNTDNLTLMVDKRPINEDCIATNALSTVCITKNGSIIADNKTNETLPNTNNMNKYAPTNINGKVKNTSLNTGGILRKGPPIANGRSKINTDNCSSFINDSNVHSTTPLGGITSSVANSAINGNSENPHTEQNSKRALKYRKNPDLSFTHQICRKACNSNCRHSVHNETLTSKSQKNDTDKHIDQHRTAINITTGVVNLDLKTTPSTQEKSADKPDEIKQKLSKSSLEAAVTRNAFLLTLTFVVSYLPFFFVSIPQAIDRDFDYSKDAVVMNLVNTVVRLYFLMPVISPAIFWASNLDFRRKCKALCSRNNTVVA